MCVDVCVRERSRERETREKFNRGLISKRERERERERDKMRKQKGKGEIRTGCKFDNRNRRYMQHETYLDHILYSCMTAGIDATKLIDMYPKYIRMK